MVSRLGKGKEMIEFNNTTVMGFPGAIRGMRQPYKATDKSDSFYCDGMEHKPECDSCPFGGYNTDGSFDCLAELERDRKYIIGLKDHELAMKLCNAGPEHRKFLRMIHCQTDIKAPIYWWKQFDTYKIGTVANSESTMHTITKKMFTLADFDFKIGDLLDDVEYAKDCLRILNICNKWREKYLDTKDKNAWDSLIRILPESYLQTRTIDLNYEVLRSIYHQRKNHKLTEWHEFCEWIETLPYSEFITGVEK